MSSSSVGDGVGVGAGESVQEPRRQQEQEQQYDVAVESGSMDEPSTVAVQLEGEESVDGFEGEVGEENDNEEDVAAQAAVDEAIEDEGDGGGIAEDIGDNSLRQPEGVDSAVSGAVVLTNEDASYQNSGANATAGPTVGVFDDSGVSSKNNNSSGDGDNANGFANSELQNDVVVDAATNGSPSNDSEDASNGTSNPVPLPDSAAATSASASSSSTADLAAPAQTSNPNPSIDLSPSSNNSNLDLNQNQTESDQNQTVAVAAAAATDTPTSVPAPITTGPERRMSSPLSELSPAPGSDEGDDDDEGDGDDDDDQRPHPNSTSKSVMKAEKTVPQDPALLFQDELRSNPPSHSNNSNTNASNMGMGMNMMNNINPNARMMNAYPGLVPPSSASASSPSKLQPGYGMGGMDPSSMAMHMNLGNMGVGSMGGMGAGYPGQMVHPNVNANANVNVQGNAVPGAHHPLPMKGDANQKALAILELNAELFKYVYCILILISRVSASAPSNFRRFYCGSTLLFTYLYSVASLLRLPLSFLRRV